MQIAKLAAALSLTACIPTAALAGYGLDIVPGSSFEHRSWHYYGTDQVPGTGIHTAGLLTAYGSDRIPGTLREMSHQHPHHLLISETIQHLTGAVEVTPERVRPTNPGQKATSPPAPRETKCLPSR
jgi:hypothetical protein